MSVLKYFKSTPGRPMGGRQTLSVIFLFKFATRFLAKKNQGACRPTNGRHGPVAHPRGDRSLSPTRGATASHAKSAALWVRSRMQLSEV